MPPEPSSSASAGQQETYQANENRDPEDDDLTEVPLRIQSVREGLLDFDHFLGLQAAMLLTCESDQDDIPLSAYKSDAETGSQRAREQEFAESAQALVGSAKNADDWQEWKRLIRDWMKKRVNSAQEGGSMGQKSLNWVGWRPWKAHKASEEDSIPWTSPGLYLGFPMHDSNTSKGFDKDPSFSNYTLKNLETLSKHGLRCVPLFDDSFQVPTPCFPWAVFYIFGTTAGGKSTSEDSFYESIVSRAAAAASTALSMFEGLAKFAEEKHDGCHIPPVIAVTIVGVKTTVWLAYCEILDERLRDHKMISIWEGNLTKIWDAIQFCRIIDNLFFWAQHCLKPMVTKYLDQWIVRSFPSAPNIHSQIKKDTKTAELIDRVQDRLSSFGISMNEDLSSLIQQAVILQEVMKPSDEMASIGSNFEEETRSSKNSIALPNSPMGIVERAIPAGSADPHKGKEAGTPSEESHIPQPNNNSDHQSELSSKTPTQVEQNLAGSDIDKKSRAEKEVEQHQSVAGDDEGRAAQSCELRSPTSVPLLIENETTINILSNKRKHEGPQNPTIQEDTGEDAGEDVGENTKDALLAVTNDKSKSDAKVPFLSSTNAASQTGSPSATIDQGKSSESIKTKPPTPETAKIVWGSDPVRPTPNYLQLALRKMASRIRNGHVISLERQRSERLDRIPEEREKVSRNRELFSEEPVTSNKPSVAPNPFVSDIFQLSFTVRSWLGPRLDEYLAGPDPYRGYFHGPYPTLQLEKLEFQRGLYLSERGYIQAIKMKVQLYDTSVQKKEVPGSQPTAIEPLPPPSQFKVKIPWRGRRCIVVNLPPPVISKPASS